MSKVNRTFLTKFVTLTRYKDGYNSLLARIEIIGIEELELILDFTKEDRIRKFWAHGRTLTVYDLSLGRRISEESVLQDWQNIFQSSLSLFIIIAPIDDWLFTEDWPIAIPAREQWLDSFGLGQIHI